MIVKAEFVELGIRYELTGDVAEVKIAISQIQGETVPLIEAAKVMGKAVKTERAFRGTEMEKLLNGPGEKATP